MCPVNLNFSWSGEGTSVLGQVSGKGHELDEVTKNLGSYFQKNSFLKRKNKVSVKTMISAVSWPGLQSSSQFGAYYWHDLGKAPI